MMRLSTLLAVVTFSSLSACAWVSPSKASHKVVLADLSEVGQCTKKGSTTSKTVSKFWFIPRGQEKILTELVTLAKNEAVILGGDTVVPQAPMPTDGVLTYSVYDCR